MFGNNNDIILKRIDDKKIMEVKIIMRDKILIFVVLLIVVLGVSMITGGTNTDDLDQVLDLSDVENTELIYVHICGAVLEPGTYEVAGTSRILDVIEVAGGLTDAADVNKNNYSKKVIDGEKIIILGKEDLIEDFPELAGKLNINTATITELISLNGIGETIAKRIVDYRYDIGLFNTVEDLLNVDGIGESKLEAIKEEICTY